MGGFSAIFSRLEDPRTGNARRHDLCELLVIALCSCLCGGTTCTDMAEFAEDKEPFLRDFLTLKNGLPSHDTFSRLFRLLDPGAFGECFSQFMREFSQQTAGVVAIDGKTLRRSFDAANAKSALHMVSAWSCDERVVLAQIATDEKSNEIPAVPHSAAPESQGTHGDHGRDELSEGNRPTDRQPGRSLRSVSERQPARDVGRCQTLSRRPRGSGDCDP